MIMIGAGGHARVVADAIARLGATVLGCVSPKEQPGTEAIGVGRILGDDDAALAYHATDVLLVNGVGFGKGANERARIFDRFSSAGFCFATIVDPWAKTGSRIAIGEASQVLAGVVLQPDCRIGCNAVINTGARIDHDCVLGDHVHIAPGAILAGGVTIGACSQIGAGAVVVQNVLVGEMCVIAAGAVVVGNVPAGTTVMGVPARPAETPKATGTHRP